MKLFNSTYTFFNKYSKRSNFFVLENFVCGELKCTTSKWENIHFAFFSSKTSLKVNTLSAIMSWFSSNKSIKHSYIVSSLSEVFPRLAFRYKRYNTRWSNRNLTFYSCMVLIHVIWKSQTLVYKARRCLNINFCAIINDSN